MAPFGWKPFPWTTLSRPASSSQSKPAIGIEKEHTSSGVCFPFVLARNLAKSRTFRPRLTIGDPRQAHADLESDGGMPMRSYDRRITMRVIPQLVYNPDKAERGLQAMADILAAAIHRELRESDPTAGTPDT